MIRALLALALALALCAGCIVQPAAARCAGATCEQCLAASGCGWCNATGFCEPGTSFAPTGSSCDDWHFASCTVGPPGGINTPCLANHDCTSCVDDLADACAWCPTSNRCLSQRSSSCLASPAFDTAACEELACNARATCDVCVGVPQCTWCDRSGVCTAQTTCPREYAYHDFGCPAPDHCSANGDCGTCTAAAGCAWCIYANDCVAQAGSSCSELAVEPVQCP